MKSVSLVFHFALTIVQRAVDEEARALLVLARLPHHCYLLNRNVAYLPVIVLQVKHTIINFDNLSAQAASAAAENIHLAPRHLRKKLTHKLKPPKAVTDDKRKTVLSCHLSLVTISKCYLHEWQSVHIVLLISLEL